MLTQRQEQPLSKIYQINDLLLKDSARAFVLLLLISAAAFLRREFQQSHYCKLFHDGVKVPAV